MSAGKLRIGVALTKCFYCNENDKIVLDRRLRVGKSPVELAHGRVIDMEPCKKCADLMKQGIILITIDDEKSSGAWKRSTPPDPDDRNNWLPNPYRTGGFWMGVEQEHHRWITDHGEEAEDLGYVERVREKH